jgi:hypothetical protein
MARLPFLRDAHVAGSSGHLGRDGGRSGGGGFRRKGRQGTFVAAPFRATAFLRSGRRRFRHLDLFLASLRDLDVLVVESLGDDMTRLALERKSLGRGEKREMP